MPKDDKNKKRSWRDVVSGRNPELNMDDEDAVASYMEETFNNYDRMEGDQRQLNDLLTRDPQAAGILTGLSSGMDDDNQPFSLTAYLLDNYYDEIVNSESKEEAIEKARKKEAQHIKEAAEAEKRKKQSADNLAASDEALTAAMNEANADEATVSAMLAWLYGEAGKDDGFIYRIVRNEVGKDDWTRLLYAFRREADLDAARREGARESRTRSGNPQRTLRKDVPSDLGGGGSVVNGPEDEDPTVARYRGMKRRYS